MNGTGSEITFSIDFQFTLTMKQNVVKTGQKTVYSHNFRIKI